MTDPAVTRIETPPGSVLVLRMPEELHQEEALDAAEELHRQTGLPVLVVSGDADLIVTTPEAATSALSRALRVQGSDAGEVLYDLAEDGWQLIHLRP